MAVNLDFRQVIEQLLSHDNNVRKAAEENYNHAKAQPDTLVTSLFELIRAHPEEQVRNLCCVLLRRAIGTSQETLWEKLTPQCQDGVKVHLLQILSTEQNDRTRAQLTNATSELARKLYRINNNNFQWQELLGFMFNNMKSARAGERETSLLIFADIVEELKVPLRGQLPMVQQALLTGLNDPESLKVKLASFNATTNFLQILESNAERNHFQTLLPSMIQTLHAALNAKEEEEARLCLELFLDVIENYVLFLKPYLSDIISACVTIINTSHLEDDTQHMALELLISLCETKPGMMKKVPKFAETMATLIVKMMCTLEDDSDWYQGNEESGDVDITHSDVGEETLDRFSIAMGGQTLIPIFFGNILPALMQSQVWQERHTGLMIISIIAEGCEKHMKSILKDVVRNILPFMKDAHPRVRWAACNAVGQMSTDFQPEFQEMFHDSVLPSLIATMDDVGNPRVQGHAAAAVINFCEAATADLLRPHLRQLLEKLYSPAPTICPPT